VAGPWPSGRVRSSQPSAGAWRTITAVLLDESAGPSAPGAGPPWRRWPAFVHRKVHFPFRAARMAGMDATQLEKVRSGRGFFAALDQSGG
jgi:hypothetical protein